MSQPTSAMEYMKTMMWDTYEAVETSDFNDPNIKRWRIVDPNWNDGRAKFIPVEDYEGWAQTAEAEGVRQRVAAEKRARQENIRMADERDAIAKKATKEKVARRNARLASKRNLGQFQQDNASDQVNAPRDGKRKKTVHVTDDDTVAGYAAMQSTNGNGYAQGVGAQYSHYQQPMHYQRHLLQLSPPCMAHQIDPRLKYYPQRLDPRLQYHPQQPQAPVQQSHNSADQRARFQAPIPPPDYPGQRLNHPQQAGNYNAPQDANSYTQALASDNHLPGRYVGDTNTQSHDPSNGQPSNRANEHHLDGLLNGEISSVHLSPPVTEDDVNDLLNLSLVPDLTNVDFGTGFVDPDLELGDLNGNTEITGEYGLAQDHHVRQQAHIARHEVYEQHQPMPQSPASGSQGPVQYHTMPQAQHMQANQWAQAFVPQRDILRGPAAYNKQARAQGQRRLPGQQGHPQGMSYQQEPSFQPPTIDQHIPQNAGPSHMRAVRLPTFQQVPYLSPQPSDQRIGTNLPGTTPGNWYDRPLSPEVQSPKPVRPPSEQMLNILNTEEGHVPPEYSLPLMPMSGSNLDPRLRSAIPQVVRPTRGPTQQLAGPGRVQGRQQQPNEPLSVNGNSAIPSPPRTKRKLAIDKDGLEESAAPVKRSKVAAGDGAEVSRQSTHDTQRANWPQRVSDARQLPSEQVAAAPPRFRNFVPVSRVTITQAQTLVSPSPPPVQPPVTSAQVVTESVVSAQPTAGHASVEAGSPGSAEIPGSLQKRKHQEEPVQESMGDGKAKKQKSNCQEKEMSIESVLDKHGLNETPREWALKMASAQSLRKRFSTDVLTDYFTHEKLVSKGMIEVSELKLSKSVTTIHHPALSRTDDTGARQAERDRLITQEFLEVVIAQGGPYQVPAGRSERDSLILMLALDDHFQAQFSQENYAVPPDDAEYQGGWISEELELAFHEGQLPESADGA